MCALFVRLPCFKAALRLAEADTRGVKVTRRTVAAWNEVTKERSVIKRSEPVTVTEWVSAWLLIGVMLRNGKRPAAKDAVARPMVACITLIM